MEYVLKKIGAKKTESSFDLADLFPEEAESAVDQEKLNAINNFLKAITHKLLRENYFSI